jgi:hypothetical protein
MWVSRWLLAASTLLVGLLAACDSTISTDARGLDNPVASGPAFAPPPGGTCAPLPSGLVSWWSGDVGGGDVYGSNDGILQNGIGAGSSGLVGSGFTLDGVDDFVEVANSPSLDITGSLTLMTWVNVVSLSQYGASVINKGNVGNYDESYALGVGEDLGPVLLLNSGK